MRRWDFTTYDGLVVLTEQRSIAHAKLLAELSRRERLPVLHSFSRMSPTRYLLLRRLNRARSALLRADQATASVAEIARSCQFFELGRFAVAYRTVFGEVPSATLGRSQ